MVIRKHGEQSVESETNGEGNGKENNRTATSADSVLTSSLNIESQPEEGVDVEQTETSDTQDTSETQNVESGDTVDANTMKTVSHVLLTTAKILIGIVAVVTVLYAVYWVLVNVFKTNVDDSVYKLVGKSATWFASFAAPVFATSMVSRENTLAATTSSAPPTSNSLYTNPVLSERDIHRSQPSANTNPSYDDVNGASVARVQSGNPQYIPTAEEIEREREENGGGKGVAAHVNRMQPVVQRFLQSDENANTTEVILPDKTVSDLLSELAKIR